ncbi:czcB, partial [Symbiodinium necroappetens]
VWNANQANIASARSEAAAIDADLAARERVVQRQLQTLILRRQAAAGELAALEETVIPPLETALEQAETGFARGSFSFLEIYDVQQALINARLRSVDALYAIHQADIQLRRLTGSALAVLAACSQDAPEASGSGHGAEVAGDEYERGPHRGRMLREGEFALELTIFEDGVDPEFRLFPYINGQPVDPSRVTASIELGRLGGQIDRFAFAPQDDFLRGDGVVTEPHSFDVTVTASMPGMNARWQYESYEGRTTFSRDQAEAGGIEVSVTGPATLDETVEVYGEIALIPEGRAELRGWLPGRVVALNASIGDRVEAGQTLARITATESLQTYSVTSPISGVVVERGATLNGPTGSEPLFVVADPSQLHAELFIYPGDLGSVATGQPVRVTSFDGGRSAESEIEFLSPMIDPDSQRAIAQ